MVRDDLTKVFSSDYEWGSQDPGGLLSDPEKYAGLLCLSPAAGFPVPSCLAKPRNSQLHEIIKGVCTGFPKLPIAFTQTVGKAGGGCQDLNYVVRFIR